MEGTLALLSHVQGEDSSSSSLEHPMLRQALPQCSWWPLVVTLCPTAPCGQVALMAMGPGRGAVQPEQDRARGALSPWVCSAAHFPVTRGHSC